MSINITVQDLGSDHSFTHKDLGVGMADNMLYLLRRDAKVGRIEVTSEVHTNFNYTAVRNAEGEWVSA